MSASDRESWRSPVNTVMNFHIALHAGNFLSKCRIDCQNGLLSTKLFHADEICEFVHLLPLNNIVFYMVYYSITAILNDSVSRRS